MLKIAVLGASGRMGTQVIEQVAGADDLVLVGAATEPGDAAVGRDAAEWAGLTPAGIPIADDPLDALSDAEVAIDFTLPEATVNNLAAAVQHQCALVLGTTGLGDEQEAALEQSSRSIPVLYGRNMSIGVNVFTELARQAAAYLGNDYDVEILEAHHRHKADAPSGTALQIGEAVAAELGRSLAEHGVFERHGQVGPRPSQAIGFSSIRAGSIVGQHTVLFGADEEQIELTHKAIDRAVFARGALRAARWLASRSAGLYFMSDMLGFGQR